MELAIEVKDLSVSYDGKTAVDHVSVSFEKNKITSVIGPSGCGKTTMLHCLNNLICEVPGCKVTGEISLFGRPINQIPVDELRRRVGLLFQTPMPFPFSVYKNLIYAPKYHGVHGKKALDDIVQEKLEMVGLYEEIKEDLHKSALKFSGGQQQRICLARALTAEPDVLLLDEPCSALDVKSTAVIEETLLKLREKYTIIIVTHNIAQAKRISDNVVFLKDGRLVEARSAEQMFTNPLEKETQEFLGGIYG